jgi:preprotein translocase subunit SecG
MSPAVPWRHTRVGLYIFITLQILAALALIVLTAITQTKSEQGGGTGGWGTIGGKSSSSIAGLEDQLGRLTFFASVAFLLFSAIAAFFGVRS